MTLRIAFRADLSLEMGSGHVMRCLTLANALRANGAQCQFICRAHSGNLTANILQCGYFVSSLVGNGHQFKESTNQSSTNLLIITHANSVNPDTPNG